MAAVNITGWRPGFRKVEHTKSIQRATGLSLSEAKAITDDVLAGQSRTVAVNTQAEADALAAELSALGAEVVAN